MIPSLEGEPTKAKKAPSPHEVRMTVLDSNPVFLCLGGIGLMDNGLMGNGLMDFYVLGVID